MKELIYHDVEQGTDQWKALKAGKFSGTDAATLLVNGKSSDGIGYGLRKLIYAKASEHITGPVLDGYTSPDMERGTALEPLARKRYEDEFFVTVQEVGFIQYGNYFGSSPDGLVGTDGAVEIKCPSGKVYVEFLDTMEIDKQHYAQMQWLLFLTGRQWCDYVLFNPDFSPMDLISQRVYPDINMHSVFGEKIEVLEKEMDRLLHLIAKKEE